MAHVIIISGANGAGKSTLAPHLLRDTFGITDYVNADTIALGLSAFAPERAGLQAGRIMLKRLDELAASNKDFAFETTLASRLYVKWLRELQAHGYKTNLIFLWLSSAELAVARVSERVKVGGHNVPEAIVRRRYIKGLRNFFELYQATVDSWRIYNASDSVPQLIASGAKSEVKTVDDILWKQIQTAIE